MHLSFPLIFTERQCSILFRNTKRMAKRLFKLLKQKKKYPLFQHLLKYKLCLVYLILRFTMLLHFNTVLPLFFHLNGGNLHFIVTENSEITMNSLSFPVRNRFLFLFSSGSPSNAPRPQFLGSIMYKQFPSVFFPPSNLSPHFHYSILSS